MNRCRKYVSTPTTKLNGDNILLDRQWENFRGLNPTLLTTLSYPGTGYPQLRLCSDFLADLFFLDNLSNELDNHDTVSVADLVFNSFYHPMSKEFVYNLSQNPHTEQPSQHLQTHSADIYTWGLSLFCRNV
ncbi:hypothetical protein K438DRAFT_1987785 [Mycena galopus ATCC 62051]|nr:hypothetical protein K438DRAFT_1987785 [Mycena galopus ATCC 62051]